MLLTIKDIDDFQNGNGLEDIIALGTGPLLELAEMIDLCTDEVETENAPNALTSVHLLVRLLAQGLHDIDDALCRLKSSYQKTNIAKEAA